MDIFSLGKPHGKKFRAAGGESLFAPHNRDELLNKIKKERLEKAESENDNPPPPATGKLNYHEIILHCLPNFSALS